MPTLPLSRRQALLAAALLLTALVVAGRYLAGAGASAPPQQAAALVRESPAERPVLLVHVVGAVGQPGLYRLREGSRVADAVARAGGATVKADLALVNLAAPVADGTQVVVPARSRAPAGGGGGGGSGGGSGGGGAQAGPVHLNTATVEELDALPGVGPVTAQKIVDFRQANGAFASVDELDAVPGIGPARLEELRKLVAP
jgi:competence protein ComEA